MTTNHSYPNDKCTFELLSAYLDGEVTSEQRQQVQELLNQDLQTQALYKRLLNLRNSFENLPNPVPECSSQQLSTAVFAKIDRRKQKRRLLWGGGTIAAVLVTAFGAIVNQDQNPVLQIAQENNSPNNTENLVIALNEPIIKLPPTTSTIQETENLVIPLDNSLMETIKNEAE